MTIPRGGTRRRAPETMSIRLGVCIALALAAATPLRAQTLPYQSALRGDYGSGPESQGLPRGGLFQPRVEATIQYADNLTLLEDGADKISSAGLELAPGFYASYSGDDFLGAVDYSFIGRVWDESDLDDATQRLSANGRWSAVQDVFYVDGQAGYVDAVIDPGTGLNYGGIGIFNPENLVETATAGISPTLRKQFSGLELFAQYSYGRVWYLDEPEDLGAIAVLNTDDSTDQAARLALGTVESDRMLEGRIFYDWNKSEYERALPFRYDRAGFDGGWRATSTLTLVGDVGVETALDEDTTEGGLDDEFWHVGLLWRPDDRTSAEARFGQQFFGDSYFVSVSRQARILRFEASYSEVPTVDTRLVSIGDVDPGDLPVYDPGLDFGRLTNSPFVSKDAAIGVTAKGSRTSVRLSLYDNEREYLRGLQRDETSTGGTLSTTRQMTANLSADLAVSYQEYERQNLASVPPDSDTLLDKDTQVVLRLNRGFGDKLTTSLESGYFSRSGDEDYDGWWVGLRARYTP